MTSSALVLASLTLSALIGDLSGSLVLSDTMQATVQPARQVLITERDDLTWDLENLPMVELRLSWPESTASIGYGPRFLLRDAFKEDESKLLLHVVRATYTYTSRPSRLALELVGNFGRDSLRVPTLLPPDTPEPARPPPEPLPGEEPTLAPQPLQLPQPVSALSGALSYVYGTPRWELTLTQSAGLSEQSLAGLALSSPLTGGGTLPPSGIPDPSSPDLVSRDRVKTFSETTSAGLSYSWTRLLRSTFRLSYSISGGLDDEAREVLPQIRTAAGGSGLTLLLSRRDELTTDFNVSQSEVASSTALGDSDFWTVSLSEAWVRRWNPDVSTSVSAGIAATSASAANGPNGEDDGERTETVDPNVAASLFAMLYRGPGTTFSATVGTSVAPRVNPLTGELETQIAGFGGLTLNVYDTTLNTDATAAQTLPVDDDSPRVISVGVGMSQRFFEFMTLSAQYRSIWQNVAGGGVIGQREPRLWTAILTLGVVSPALDF